MNDKSGKESNDDEYGNLKYWYREVPFFGNGVDLILARRVWTLIYLPIFLLSAYLTITSINYIDWWHVFIFIPICWWCLFSLNFIWRDA